MLFLPWNMLTHFSSLFFSKRKMRLGGHLAAGLSRGSHTTRCKVAGSAGPLIYAAALFQRCPPDTSLDQLHRYPFSSETLIFQRSDHPAHSFYSQRKCFQPPLGAVSRVWCSASPHLQLHRGRPGWCSHREESKTDKQSFKAI